MIKFFKGINTVNFYKKIISIDYNWDILFGLTMHFISFQFGGVYVSSTDFSLFSNLVLLAPKLFPVLRF